MVVNDLANLPFLRGLTNRKTSNKAPATYLPEVIKQQGEEALTAQRIPRDTSLMTVEQFTDFLAQRRQLIAKRLNHFLADARKTS